MRISAVSPFFILSFLFPISSTGLRFKILQQGCCCGGSCAEFNGGTVKHWSRDVLDKELETEMVIAQGLGITVSSKSLLSGRERLVGF